MGHTKRRDNFTAGIVNHAVNLGYALGWGEAARFMRRWAVPGHVIARILMDSANRRAA